MLQGDETLLEDFSGGGGGSDGEPGGGSEGEPECGATGADIVSIKHPQRGAKQTVSVSEP